MPVSDLGLFYTPPTKKQGFADVAGTNAFTASSTTPTSKQGFAPFGQSSGTGGFNDNQRGSAMNFAQNNVLPQINSAGTTSNGMTIPSNTALTDAQMGALYQQQRELAGVRELGVSNEQYRNSSLYNPPSSPAAAVSGGGSRAQSTGPAPIPEVLISQDLSQRTPSGSVYAPDLSAYNDSSLFNYTGPGGVDEYTYGQGLRTGGADYSIFGSPADIANPYYEGQFAPRPEPVGPADGAISMNPVQLPGDLPQIEVSADVSMPGFVGGSSPTDLTYQQTIDEMGIFGPNNPPPSTTFPSPGDITETDQQYQDILNQSLMDNQTQAETAMGDRSGFPNDNRVITASIPGMTMDDTAAIEQGMAAPETFMSGGSPNGRGGFDLYYDRDDVPKMSLDPNTFETSDSVARDVAAGMAENLETLMEQGTRLQTMYDVAEGRQRAGERENLLQNQDVEAANYQRALDAQKIELDKQRYNTQISNPTADFSGYMRNYGSGFTEPQASISDVTDATPMQFANNAGQMEARNTSIFDAKREDSPFAKGPAQEIKNIFDEQQNYEVPASEMSPGETGLINGIVEGLKAFGPNDERSMGEQKAWDRYGDYKSAGIEALNKGEIDEKAFNEIKGKAGSETVINHFVDSSKNPKTNNFMTNASNIFYQAMDVIVGDDSIKDGIVDYYQQKKGVNSTEPLGSVAEEIAKAKEATAQRKEVQENIFTPGPMKFAAAASKPDPAVAKKAESAKKAAAAAKAKAEAQAKAKAEQARSKAAAKPKAEAAAKAKAKKEADEAARKARENARKPAPAPKRVTVSYNKNKPTPVKKSKPTGRGPQPSKPTRTTGSRGGRGNVGATKRLTGGR